MKLLPFLVCLLCIFGVQCMEECPRNETTCTSELEQACFQSCFMTTDPSDIINITSKTTGFIKIYNYCGWNEKIISFIFASEWIVPILNNELPVTYRLDAGPVINCNKRNLPTGYLVLIPKTNHKRQASFLKIN